MQNDSVSSMSEQKPTIGHAIDTIIATLTGLPDDKSRELVLTAVQTHLGLTSIAKSDPPPDYPPAVVDKPRPGTPIIDIRSLKEEKQPATASQMACIVGYYLREIAVDPEHKDTIIAQDIDKYFKQAGFKLPKRPDQLLVDCKQSGYFDFISSGVYKLNAVGHNLVAHSLPKNKK